MNTPLPSPDSPVLTKGQSRATVFFSRVFLILFLAAVIGVIVPAVHGVWVFWRDVFTTQTPKSN